MRAWREVVKARLVNEERENHRPMFDGRGGLGALGG